MDRSWNDLLADLDAISRFFRESGRYDDEKHINEAAKIIRVLPYDRVYTPARRISDGEHVR